MPDFIKDNHIYHNPVEFVITKIGGTYKMPILWRLKDKKWRYNELQKSMSYVSDRMLAKALKELILDGFITKEIFPEVPPKVEYTLTERGERAIKIIDSLRQYGFELMSEFGINDASAQ